VVKAHVDKNLKMEGDYHGQSWTMWFLHKEGIKLLDIHHWSSAVCGEIAPSCSSVFKCCLDSDKETAQAAVYEWYCSTPKE
jgi:hypothetical protein